MKDPTATTTKPTVASRSIDEFYNEAYEQGTSNGRFQYWLLFLALGIANSGDATEIGCMNYILSHPLFKEEILANRSGNVVGVGEVIEEDYGGRGAAIASSIFAGMLIGGIVTGAYGDKLGRRPTLLAGLFLNAISGISSSMAPTAAIICLCRFSAGLGIGAVLASLITLASELSPSAHRGWYITVIAGFWTMGSVFIAMLAYVLFGRNDYSWRIFVLIAASPTLVGGVLVWAIVPESPRYLALHGRYDEATRVANDIGRAMGYRGMNGLTVTEMRDHYGHYNTAESWVNSGSGHTTTQLQPLSDKRAMRKIGDLYRKELVWTVTIPLQIVWFSMSFGSGLCTWITKLFEEIGLTNIYLQSLYFAMANIPGNLSACFLVDTVGRKALLFGSMTSAALSLGLAAHGASEPETRQLQVILSACAFHSFLVMGWCALSVMTSELFPTSIRGTGMGVCAGVGRVAGILVQYVNGAFIDRPLVLLLTAASCMMAGAFAPIAMNMPDMTDKHLSEVPGKAIGAGDDDSQATHKIV